VASLGTGHDTAGSWLCCLGGRLCGWARRIAGRLRCTLPVETQSRS